MRRFVATLLICSLMSMIVSPAVLAQEVGGTTKEDDPETVQVFATIQEGGDSWVNCHNQGKMDGESVGTGGSVVGGLAGGVLLGLIGTGIAVLAQSKPDPTSAQIMMLEGQSEECRYTYIESFRNAAHSKKKTAALTGGLIGTAIIVAVILSSGSN